MRSFIVFFFLPFLLGAQTPIKDSLGRTLILHGLNTASGAKHAVGHQPWVTEADIDREYTEFGFNAVRYLVFWGAIEPQQGVFDTLYLNEVKKRAEWYTSHKMYVIIDMHQDVFGYGVGGNGAPEWACTQTKRQNVIPDKWAWWLQNLEPKVIKSYVQFFKYKKRKELQDHYIQSYLKVVEIFKDNPYVVGYDLMNEPHGGRLAKTLLGGFERRQLDAFYKRIIPAIRGVDTTRYIFFEPRSFGVNFGMKSHLKKVADVGTNKLVYAPHCYMQFVDVGGNYKKRYQRALQRWYRRRDAEVKLHGAGFLIGEFGLSPQKKDFDKYLQDIFTMADARHASWTYWASDLGGWGPLDAQRNPTPILTELVRAYPQATAGTLQNFAYNPVSREFTMEFISDSTINAPTMIAIPRSKYNYGANVKVEGASKLYKYYIDWKTYILYFTAEEHNVTYKLTVTPK